MSTTQILPEVLTSYIRLILYPLTIMGFIILIVNEYTTKKDLFRISSLVAIVFLFSYLFVTNLIALLGYGADYIIHLRTIYLTPIVALCCVSIWLYILLRNKL
jgi:hypothetical protein